MVETSKANSKAKVRKATISARVYRAETGKWEDLGVISKTKLTLIERFKRFFGR